MALPDFPPLPDFAPLPSMPPPPDIVATILVEAGAVLFLRRSGHRGTYLVLPGGFVSDHETLAVACLRCATKEILEAARELAQQLRVDLHEDEILLSVGSQIHKTPWDRRTIHYFAAASNHASILGGPAAQPRIAAEAMVWPTYEWVPFAGLKSRKIGPMDITACEVMRGIGS